jgi:flavin reductase (DIM6/NTAB) family NADH-FMN oxidoreductase RutF/rubredoxin
MIYQNQKQQVKYMNTKALYDLTYGLFVLSAKGTDKENGCIINTCMQVASDPCRIAISVLNHNYTCDLVKESGRFALSILDKTTPFELIRHFGMQSGRDTDKMKDYDFHRDADGLAILAEHACAYLSAKVIDSLDLGTHTLFIAEVMDANLCNDQKPLTYAYYQEHIKPKPEMPKEEKKIVAWRCKICGYIYDKADLPEDFICPWCGHGAQDFEPVYEQE